MKKQLAALLTMGMLATAWTSILPNHLSYAAAKNDIIEAEDIELTRTMDGDYTFIFKETGTWTVYESQTPNSFSPIPLFQTTETNYTVDDLNPNLRYYFKAVNREKGDAIVSERRINFELEENFRDMGGYKTDDGRSLKWGLLYRSGALDEFSDKDRALFDRLNIKTIIDFRTEENFIEKPDLISNDVVKISAPIFPGSFDHEEFYAAMKDGDIPKARALFIETDSEDLPMYNDSLKRYFDVLETAEGPIMYYCAGGKDRTGLSSALLLHALGVDPEIYYGDYMDTNKWGKNNIAEDMERIEKCGWNKKTTLMKSIVTYEKMDEMLGAIQEKYGTIDYYLIHVLDVDIAKLRDKYLE